MSGSSVLILIITSLVGFVYGRHLAQKGLTLEAVSQDTPLMFSLWSAMFVVLFALTCVTAARPDLFTAEMVIILPPILAMISKFSFVFAISMAIPLSQKEHQLKVYPVAIIMIAVVGLFGMQQAEALNLSQAEYHQAVVPAVMP